MEVTFMPSARLPLIYGPFLVINSGIWGASKNLVANSVADSGGYETFVKITIVISLLANVLLLHQQYTAPTEKRRFRGGIAAVVSGVSFP
jgi:hypothetical protein